ncbi:hypothetical protein AGABI2DRAFT_116525 [Agaricus bisporus var. bisporus H97]|nr:hypothetical protein AGABI2DRAFT_116525 [Agaricus bisporus var. bisporus H97]EKV49489.1 hypothetical protein AGABI2DRAFT_116525 [Agaricus bisporus var. bisporus H97]
MAVLECPRCGYNVPNELEAAYPHIIDEPATWSDHEDIPTLQSEVEILDDLISRLNQEKSAVLSKINSLQATTRKLPPEILSTIFQIARPPIDFDSQYTDLDIGSNTYHPEEDFHHTLAAVSNFWRLVALSTPRLWGTITLRVDGRRSITNVASLLDLHFQRARGVPIAIQLDFHGAAELWDNSQRATKTREESLSLLEPLRTAVFVKNAAMIRHLILIEPPTEWLRFLNGNMLRCHSLTIFRPVPPRAGLARDILDLSELPCLERVQLIKCSLPFSIPETVTTLHLRKLAFIDCFKALTRFRNLVDFEIIKFDPPEVSMPAVTGPIVFPRLERFRWSASTHDGLHYCSQLFHHLQFPALRSLQWSDNRATDIRYLYSPRRDPRLDLFSNLPASLTTLTFIDLRPHFERQTVIQHLLNCVPQVCELNFVECSRAVVGTAVRAIGRPLHASGADYGQQQQQQETREEQEEEGEGEQEEQQQLRSVVTEPIKRSPGSPILPNLRKLTITNAAGWAILDKVEGEDIVDMVEVLCMGRTSRERFELVVSPESSWDHGKKQKVLGRLKGLVRDGFEVEVGIGSRTLDLS